MAGFCECGNEPLRSTKCGEFLDQLEILNHSGKLGGVDSQSVTDVSGQSFGRISNGQAVQILACLPDSMQLWDTSLWTVKKWQPW